jgi:hypothetical protein
MKSGSTFLQATAFDNRDVLLREGIRFYGPETRTAVLDLKQARKLPEANVGDWSRFVDLARATPSHFLISNELLFPLPVQQVREVAAALDSHELHVVVTLRDLTKVAPSHWQERVAAGSRLGWTQFCNRMCREAQDPNPGGGFWAAYDVVPVISRWLELVPAERFTVVVVPPSGSDPRLLWDRFLSVLEVPGTGTTLATHHNPSMGATSTELLREVTGQVADLSGVDRRRVFRNVLAKQILTQRASKEPRFGLTPRVQAVLKQRAIEMVEGIRATGVQVVGDLDEFVPADTPAPGIQPEEISETELLETAVFALAELGRLMAHDRAEIIALKNRGSTEQ